MLKLHREIVKRVHHMLPEAEVTVLSQNKHTRLQVTYGGEVALLTCSVTPKSVEHAAQHICSNVRRAFGITKKTRGES